MLKLIAFPGLFFLIAFGCRSDSKYQYLENPYSNPVVQRDYAEWIDQYQMSQLAARVRFTPEELTEMYEEFMEEYTYRERVAKDAMEKEKLRHLIAFCKASYSCEAFLKKIEESR